MIIGIAILITIKLQLMQQLERLLRFSLGEYVNKELIIENNNKFIDYSKKYRSDF